MGTSWSARFFCAAGEYRHLIEEQLDSIVRQMSHWEPESELSRFNCCPPGEWQTLSAEFFTVLDYALQVARDTDGAFDPTIGAAVEKWGFGPARREDMHPAGGWKRIELDREGRRARHSGNIALDFSSAAKGFAVDRVASLLEESGVQSYLVEIGGELRARGLKPSRAPWWVSIEPPGEAPAGFPEFRIALSGWAVATSGDYRRYFEADGRRWTHTIDPRTGRPVDPGLASVSVIHRECMAADAYSTALLVMGADEGLKFAERHGLAALFILRGASGLEMRCTDSLYRMTSA